MLKLNLCLPCVGGAIQPTVVIDQTLSQRLTYTGKCKSEGSCSLSQMLCCHHPIVVMSPMLLQNK